MNTEIQTKSRLAWKFPAFVARRAAWEAEMSQFCDEINLYSRESGQQSSQQESDPIDSPFIVFQEALRAAVLGPAAGHAIWGLD
jgi:predicted TIM-barrel fold metal-dependent hydrolase